ncbi:hypothetical protein MKW94_009713 [Papaver nudicaule]|uniref:Uncharacterized protein n=1 Tax=Papaver nudicaule TaxID=74823 RepID=A0AA41VJA0_PAPNU|nr:hypothetical protein [Papaver nudicaule]
MSAASSSSLLGLPEISINSFITQNPKKKRNNGKVGFVKVRCLSKSITKNLITKKYCDVKVNDVYNLVEFSSHFSAPVKEKQKNDKDDEEKQNYYVNSGYAIRTLREEFPQIFYKELNFDIYRDDIVFKDPLNTFVGIKNYKSIFWALRFYGKIFFKGLWVDIINVSQPMGVDKVIMVRWTIHGIPRVPWESHGRFDGTSEYKLDKHGKIYEHKVDNIALSSPPRFGVRAVEELIQSLGVPSTPRPTYFETLSSSVSNTTPFILRFTWVRYYLAFKLALSWRSASESGA